VDCLAGQGPVLKSATILSIGAASSKIGGGGEYSYLRVLHYYLVLKSIVFMVCEHKYMNIRPPPPNYRAGGATDFKVCVMMQFHAF
jgi:hypothetical protein